MSDRANKSFVECPNCAAKPGSAFCNACLHNRALIEELRYLRGYVIQRNDGLYWCGGLPSSGNWTSDHTGATRFYAAEDATRTIRFLGLGRWWMWWRKFVAVSYIDLLTQEMQTR